MKHFLKVFSIAFLCFALAMVAGLFTFFKFYNSDNNVINEATGMENEKKESDIEDEGIKDPFKKAISESKRVNFLLLGMEGPRTDTIIFASFDPKENKVDMFSIPRDTYYYRPGYEHADKRKINAVYGDEGISGIKAAVSNLLGDIPIEHYIIVDYEGVKKVVDVLGGVEVNVPFHMEYKDPTDNPPLIIDIPKGKQVLDGENAIKFLRWRHNNDMTVGYPDGDLGRVRAQQQFIQSALKKALSFKLPTVVKTCFNYVKTDMKLTDALLYAGQAIGISGDDFSIKTIDGEAENRTYGGLKRSYFIYDKEKVRELMMELYNVKEETN